MTFGRLLMFLTTMVFLGSGIAFAQNELGKQRWTLAEIDGKAVKAGNASLVFGEDRKTFSGRGGCNAISGVIENVGDREKLTVKSTTKMLCSRPGAMETERSFLEAIGKSDGFAIKNGVLTILKGKRAVARLLMPGAQLVEREIAAKLSRNNWRLVSIGLEPSVDKINGPTLYFDDEPGLFDGNAGCNRIGGSYKATDDSFSFGEISTTLMACLNGRSATEREFLDRLKRTNRFEITKDGELKFFEGEIVLLTFAAMKD